MEDFLRGVPLIGPNLHRIPVAGPLLFGNPAQEAHEQKFQEAASAYQQYRPEALQARVQAMRNAFSVMQGTNTMRQKMGLPGLNLEQAGQNPFGPAGAQTGAAQQPPGAGRELNPHPLAPHNVRSGGKEFAQDAIANPFLAQFNLGKKALGAIF